MLKLKRVSKFYSANGVVTSGFSKVSLDFDIGEFVAITGESGSGKSTLLNVISGLDSYEEGEMYINGIPTSGYGSEDMENYRKRYIGNIFQTFNLINNYTVYQNVEMVLLLSGYTRREARGRVNDIIERVGLKDFKRTKASKLSGGQKQRVAIARALAKETPIIVADEPTGNLDVASAADIIKLLAELAEDKLIIIVTHNYEQVEPYITRKITMHDGRVVEDEKFKKSEEVQKGAEAEAEAKAIEAKEARHDGMSFGNTLRLGTRNTFSLPAKFLLLLFVFLFLCMGTFGSYSTFQSMKNSRLTDMVFSQIFSDAGPTRLVVTKADRGSFEEADYDKLSSIENVSRIERNDVMVDTLFECTSATQYEMKYSDDLEMYYWMLFKAKEAAPYEGTLVEGRMPENANEAILIFNDDDYYMNDMIETVMGRQSYLSVNNRFGGWDENAREASVTVVGYGYYTDAEKEEYRQDSMYYEGKICMTEEGLKELESMAVATLFRMEGHANRTVFSIGGSYGGYSLIPTDKLEPGHIWIPEEVGSMYKWGSYYGKTLDITAKTMYHSNAGTYTIDAAYGLHNYQWLLGYSKWEEVPQGIYMNPADIKALYLTEGNHQTTVRIDETLHARETINAIEKAGYDVLYIYEAANQENAALRALVNLFRTGVLVVLLIVLFFISYFIIKLIFKSRNVYFSTVRMLGGSKAGCSGMLYVEMLIVFHLAFLASAGVLIAVKKGLLDHLTGIGGRIVESLHSLIFYVEYRDFAILYAVILMLTLLLALRYSGQMFKQTAMNAYKEEA